MMETTVPTVSVIVPCHNGGRFLPGLVANLAEQRFRDFEVVIVNNGSTETETLQTLDRLRSNIRVIDQENRYLPGARNTGFREARASLVLPLDCDDRLDPSFLDRTVSALQGAGPDVGFVFTHMALSGALRGVIKSRFDPFDQLFLNRLPYCMLVRKSAWQKAGGYDQTMRDGTEDWEFNIRLAKAGYHGLRIAEPLFIYCVRSDGMLLSKSARMQGTIWRNIRSRHPDLYRGTALIASWSMRNNGWTSAAKALALLGATKIMPEVWYNAVCFRLIMLARRWRVARGRLRVAEADDSRVGS